MGEPRIMVAVDPDALNALREELAALRNEIRGVRMVQGRIAPGLMSPPPYGGHRHDAAA